MERFSITLLLFVILGSAYCELPDPCKITAFMECRNASTESAFGNLNGQLPDEAFLEEHCDALSEQLGCLLEHDRTCPLSFTFFDGPQDRFHGLSGTKNLVDDICDDDSSLRKDYLQSIGCLDANNREIKKDFIVMETMINRFNRHYLMENEEKNTTDEMVLCVIFAFAYNDIKNIFEKHCGPVASDAFVAMVNHIAIVESDQCLRDQENFDRLNELLESFRSSEENIHFNIPLNNTVV